MANNVIIEKNKRFSESALWALQREYFDQQGIDAWVNQVPFYVTSNPFIANCYAEVVIHFVRDWVAQHPDAKKHPFYVMELGTGSGKFSFYVLKKLFELRRELAMEDVPICYIMSDFTQNNLKYWDEHPSLRPYVEQGLLDFAIYNMEGDEPITLVKKNLTLTPESFVNPLTVFANYIFDTISHDIFSVKNGKLQEVLVSLSTDKSNMRDDKPVDWERIAIDYKGNDIPEAYYPDPAWNAILAEYKTTLKDTSVLFPVGGLMAVKKLRRLANDKLLLISSDKGYSSLESLDKLGHPTIAFHGSFSMMVNFHAIAEYFKHTGGDYVLQTPRKGIKTVVFSAGINLKKMPETSKAIADWVEGFSPADYFILHRRISESFQDCNIETLASHLALSGWDPYIYQRISGRLCSLVNEADEATLEFISTNVPKMLANFYPMPKGDNTVFEMAVFFHMAKQYEQALEYYQKSAAYLTEKFGLLYNVALCQYHMGRHADALETFKQAKELDANSKETIEWIEYIKNTHDLT